MAELAEGSHQPSGHVSSSRGDPNLFSTLFNQPCECKMVALRAGLANQHRLSQSLEWDWDRETVPSALT
jgi:hypothetical protein